jgi:thiamine-monophosphate kinase
MKTKTVSDLGEFGLIARLARKLATRTPSVARGIGDDCALLRAGNPKHFLLLTCDPVVEGIHYLPGTPARRVGWKAMARNLSDIAAMGGLPRWAVVSVGLRANTPVRWVEQLYDGLRSAARQFNCDIVGGDTTHVAREPFVVVTLLGEVEKNRVALRTGARNGDIVFVTGKLGGSLRGKHLRFTPRIVEARWLVEHFPIHAMIDVSDGLASDLQRLADASKVGFDIASCLIPANRRDLRAALTDGEDFELLFTVSSRDADRLRAKWKFKLPLTAIGHVTRQRGIRLDSAPLTAKGYDHFH